MKKYLYLFAALISIAALVYAGWIISGVFSRPGSQNHPEQELGINPEQMDEDTLLPGINEG